MAAAKCDECDIRQVLGRAIVISDFEDLAELALVYLPDAIWVSGDNRREGFDAIIAGLAAFRASGRGGPGSNAIHFSMPLTVSVDGDHASAISHFALLDGSASPKAITAAGTYRDQLARTVDGWRISRREMTLT